MALKTDRRTLLRNSALWAAAIPALPATAAVSQDAGAGNKTTTAFYDVKQYGATGVKADNAGPAIQKAIEACSAAGRGHRLPASGGIHLGHAFFAQPCPISYRGRRYALRLAKSRRLQYEATTRQSSALFWGKPCKRFP